MDDLTGAGCARLRVACGAVELRKQIQQPAISWPCSAVRLAGSIARMAAWFASECVFSQPASMWQGSHRSRKSLPFLEVGRRFPQIEQSLPDLAAAFSAAARRSNSSVIAGTSVALLSEVMPFRPSSLARCA